MSRRRWPTDRAGDRPAAYRALAQRPGGARFPPVGRRERKRVAEALKALIAALWNAPRSMRDPHAGIYALQAAQPVTFGHHCWPMSRCSAATGSACSDARAA